MPDAEIGIASAAVVIGSTFGMICVGENGKFDESPSRSIISGEEVLGGATLLPIMKEAGKINP